jgi:L-threonylcarbamoyladenylate synthase
MKVITIKSNSYKKGVDKIVSILKEKKVIVCPTDTVYGIIADATNEEAVKKAFEIKKRPLDKAMPVFVKDIKMAKRIAFISGRKADFLKKIWPGKVTAVLKAKSNSGLVSLLFGDKNTVGLRIPNYKLVSDVMKKMNRPLIGTSANISGKPASTKIREVKKSFKNKNPQPDFIISVGNLPNGLPSTVINLSRKKIKILRKGDYLKTKKYKFFEK